MRTDRIIEAIHDLTLSARMRQRAMLVRTRREWTLRDAPAALTVRASTNGYIACLDLDRIALAIGAAQAESDRRARIVHGGRERIDAAPVRRRGAGAPSRNCSRVSRAP